VTGSNSPYAVHKMMQLSEKVRPCDPRKRGPVVPAQTVSRLAARNARAVASSSPRQLRHRVAAIELSAESSSVSSVSSTRKPASHRTGINNVDRRRFFVKLICNGTETVQVAPLRKTLASSPNALAAFSKCMWACPSNSSRLVVVVVVQAQHASHP